MITDRKETDLFRRYARLLTVPAALALTLGFAAPANAANGGVVRNSVNSIGYIGIVGTVYHNLPRGYSSTSYTSDVNKVSLPSCSKVWINGVYRGKFAAMSWYVYDGQVLVVERYSTYTSSCP